MVVGFLSKYNSGMAFLWVDKITKFSETERGETKRTVNMCIKHSVKCSHLSKSLIKAV